MHCAIYACCSGTPRSIFEKTMVWPKLRCQEGGHNGKLSTSNQTGLTTIFQRVQIYQFAMNIQSSGESRSIDIDLLACVLLFGGGTGMAGALVSPELGLQPWLLFRTEAMSGLMVLVGLGLLMRLDWARRFAAGALMYAVYAQCTRRWMQSDLVQAWLSCVQGHPLREPAWSGDLPALDGATALWSLLLCAVLVWLTRRLLSDRVRLEFAEAAAAGTAASTRRSPRFH